LTTCVGEPQRPIDWASRPRSFCPHTVILACFDFIIPLREGNLGSLISLTTVINAGSGVPAQYIKRVTAVSKAYTTRVGSGPFPTELFDDNGEKIRKIGVEFGTTTGRPRRCGWLDLELLRFSAQVNGLTDLVITKLDVLDGLKTIKLCLGYILNGKKVSYVDCDSHLLKKVKPIYKTIPGWQQPTRDIKKFKDLPKQAKDYLKEIEKNIKIPISIISVGPERNQTIYAKL